MPSTTNFSWTTPADTDYVKDGASAIRTLANGIDTSMAQLKGGTTGQVLSKTNGTDMSFTWVTPQVGDITSVTASTGLQGGGTTGDVTLSIDSTVATLTGSQTLTNKTLTTPVISSISNTGTLTLPTSTDTLVGRATTDTLTNKTISATSNTISGVINNTLTTTTGDLIYASAANTPARLAIGSSNQVLTVSGGVPTWATAASGGGWTSLGTATLSSSVTTVSFTATGYRNIVLQVYDPLCASAGGLIIKPNNTANLCTFTTNGNYNGGSAVTNSITVNGNIYHGSVNTATSGTNKMFVYLVFNNPASTTYSKTFTGLFSSNAYNNNVEGVYCFDGYVNTTSALSSFGFSHQGGNFISGDVTVYGVK